MPPLLPMSTIFSKPRSLSIRMPAAVSRTTSSCTMSLSLFSARLVCPHTAYPASSRYGLRYCRDWFSRGCMNTATVLGFGPGGRCRRPKEKAPSEAVMSMNSRCVPAGSWSIR